ncbi:MAG: hypothetical protein ABH854_05515 [Candidatus Diapherotrites archaeon]|nr:hypothetical protein [Candidatus Micrarchaeota archaeon]
MPARTMRGIVRGFGTIKREISDAETPEEFGILEAELADPDVLLEVGEENVRLLKELIKGRLKGMK